MGLYDHLRFKIACPTCGEPMEDFQSKDGACCMETLEITDVDNFYSSCDKCRTWVDYKRKEGKKDSYQTLMEAKQLLMSVLKDVCIHDGDHYIMSTSSVESIMTFMIKHPLPQQSLNDFIMTFQTKEECDKMFEEFEEDFYEKHGKEWYEFVPANVKPLEDQILELPKARPNVFIDPDLVDDEDEKD